MSEAAADDAAMTAAQRARIERNRQRARALRDGRTGRTNVPSCGGGGFLPAEEPPLPASRPAAAPAPVVHPAEQPRCLDCGRSFPQSFLYDSFDYSVCDDCRDEEGAHALVARTEAKAAFLLQDCDLDARSPPLRCLLRRNPHAPRGTMRLYLRAQLLQRAHVVWGGAAALEAERARREAARARAASSKAARRLRALRMDVRGSLFAGTEEAHRHEFGAERRAPDDPDHYERSCLSCGHLERYEKM